MCYGLEAAKKKRQNNRADRDLVLAGGVLLRSSSD